MQSIARRLLPLLHLVAMLLGNLEAGPTSSFVPVFTPGKSTAPIEEWLLLGPLSKKESKSVDECAHPNRYLELTEGATLGSIQNFVGEKRYALQFPNPYENFYSNIDFYRSLGVQADFISVKEEFFYYAACIVRNNQTKHAYLFSKAMGSISLWNNGTLIAGVGNNTSFPITLAEGDNFLLVRVSRRGSTAFSLSYVPDFESGARAAMQSATRVLSKPLYAADEQTSLKIGMDTADALIFDIDITSATGAKVANGLWLKNGEIIPGIERLPAGAYQITIKCGGATRKEIFFLGDPLKKYTELAIRAEEYKDNERVSINLHTLTRRCAILLDPENRDNIGHAWGDKICTTFFDLEAALVALESGAEAFTDVPGLHTRGFRSRIDGVEQHYRIFVPENYTREGSALPLFLIYPTIPTTSRPFLESVFIADHEGAMKMAEMANQFGAALLWIGCRCNPAGSPCDFTHLDEVINEALRDYKIDDHRVVILATCGGGINAGMSAVQFPNRFAGMGIYDGIFRRHRHRPNSNIDFWSIPSYNKWMTESDWFRRQFRLKDFPVYVIADRIKKEGQGELELSMDYVKDAKAAGAPILFEPEPEYQQSPGDPWARLFKWALLQRRSNVSPVQGPGMFENYSGPGPISRAFTERFIVVHGTGGDDTEKTATSAWTSVFLTSWRRVHYGDCVIKYDYEVTDQEIRTSNLILIGNERNNAIWKRFIKESDLRLRKDSVEIRGRRFLGDSLSVHACILNPLNTERHIILIGADDMVNARPDTMELSLDGWYDYAVWKPVQRFGRIAPFAQLIDAGFYENWLGTN
jgi:hypothetical protein